MREASKREPVLILYQNPTAVSATKVRLVLAEKNLEWEARNLDLRAGDQHKPDYLKLNPGGVVPTLVHDDRVLSESSIIMLYLDEAFPGMHCSRQTLGNVLGCASG